MSPVPQPAPPSKPPRSALTVRDMLVAMAVLGAMVLLVGGLTRACTLSPGGPSVDSSGLPVVDAPAQLRLVSRGLPFPVRVPAVPADWRANSVAQDRVAVAGAPEAAAARAVRVGYLTPADHYLRVVQTTASEADLLAAESGSAGPLPGRGSEQVAGVDWVVYGRDDGEPVRIAELPGPTPVRVLITGSGDDAEFRALAGALAAGELLPTG